MAKSGKLTQKQFAQVTQTLFAKLFPNAKRAASQPEQQSTDCVALLKFIEAAQQIYTRDCPIAQAKK